MAANFRQRYAWIVGLLLTGLWIILGIFMPAGLRFWVSPDPMQPGEAVIAPAPAAGLIRLHVLANSDTPEDQALKYLVRDRIIVDLAPVLHNSQSIDESREIVKANRHRLEQVSQEIVAGQGYKYTVQAELGCYDFPARSYGELVLPAGPYEALRVVIGKGEGANWWCVLFPPLCFVNVTNSSSAGATPEDAAKTVMASRSPAADNNVDTENRRSYHPGDNRIPAEFTEGDFAENWHGQEVPQGNLEYRCKLLDWWNNLI